MRFSELHADSPEGIGMMHDIKRRLLVGFVTVLGLLVLSSASAQGEVTILVHPTLYDATGGDGGVISEFSQNNGVSVNVVTAPTTDLFEKAIVEFVAGSGRYDVLTIKQGWLNDEVFQFLEPVDTCVEGAGSGYDPDDLIGSLVRAGVDSDGQLRAIPFRVGTSMLYYNKDMFAEHGVDVPTDWDEFLDAARKLTVRGPDGQVEVFGVGQTLYPEGGDFIRFIYGMGGTILNEDMTEPTLETPEVYAAIDLLKTLFDEELIAQESLAWDRDPQITAMQQERIAMGIFYSPYWGRIIDPEGTDDPEQFGWALSPVAEGVEPGRTLNDGWYLAIDRNSGSKDAACQLMIALTNPENQLEMALDFANGPIRTSTYLSDAYQAEFPLSAEWQAATAASEFYPPHPRVEEIRDIVNQEITNVILGRKTAEEAMRSATSRVAPLLR